MLSFMPRGSSVNPSMPFSGLSGELSPASISIPRFSVQESPNETAAQTVSRLIGSLDMVPAPQAVTHSVTNRVLGSLADGLRAFASARIGEAPTIGPYAAQLAGEKLRFQAASQDAASTNREIRNKVRLAAFQDQQERQRQIDVEKMKAQAAVDAARARGGNLKSVSSVIDVGGTPTHVVDFYNPETGEHVGRQTQGPVPPGYVPVTDVAGNMYFAPKPTQGGVQSIPVPGGGTATKPASDAEMEDAANAKVFQTSLNQMLDILKRRSGDQTGRAVESAMSHIPGNKAAESQSDVSLFNKSRFDLGMQARTLFGGKGLRNGDLVQKAIENIPEFYASPELLQKALDQLQESGNAALAERARLRPQVFGAAGAGAGAKASVDYSGRPPMDVKKFNALKPSAQKQWILGGGKVSGGD